jgi:hypothetical protein
VGFIIIGKPFHPTKKAFYQPFHMGSTTASQKTTVSEHPQKAHETIIVELRQELILNIN